VAHPGIEWVTSPYVKGRGGGVTCFAGVPRGLSPPQSDSASTQVDVALMFDHSEGIS